MTDIEDVLHEALTDMCFQFAYRDVRAGKRVLHTGGLSALEGAFYVLGWADPHVVEDCGCEIAGCEEWGLCVGAYPRSKAKPDVSPAMVGHGFLCNGHYFTWNGPHAAISPPADLGRAK